MLGVGGVGLFCGRVHLQTRGTKGNQGKIKGNQGKTKGNQGKTKGSQVKTKGNQGNKENPFNQWEYLQSIGFLSKQG